MDMVENPGTSDRATFPSTTRITSSENLLLVVDALRVIFFCFYTLVRNFYARTVLSCVCFAVIYFELLDPGVFECNEFDPTSFKY